MKSIFTIKDNEPTVEDLQKGLGDTFGIWQELALFTRSVYPDAVEKWHFSGDKYGWSFRISDKKRVLLYLLPRAGFFKVALVFGQKATDAVIASNISEEIKNELLAAKAYAEGRGIRIEVMDDSGIADIQQLLLIKIAH